MTYPLKKAKGTITFNSFNGISLWIIVHGGTMPHSKLEQNGLTSKKHW